MSIVHASRGAKNRDEPLRPICNGAFGITGRHVPLRMRLSRARLTLEGKRITRKRMFIAFLNPDRATLRIAK